MVINDCRGMPIFGLSAMGDDKLVETAVWDEKGNIQKRWVPMDELQEVRDYVNYLLGEDHD